MEQHKEEIAAAGLRSVVVGLGQPKHARRYCGQLAPSAECLCQRMNEAHEAFGLRQAGLAQLAGVKTIAAAVRAVRGGHAQGTATGDAKMLGGTFVIDREGIVRYAHYDEFAGDHADLASILRRYEASAPVREARSALGHPA